MFSVAIAIGEANALAHYQPLGVTPALRGCTEDGSQLQRIDANNNMVSITTVSARSCPSGRDLYLEKKKKLDAPSWDRSVLGHVVDKLLVNLFERGLDTLEDAFEFSLATDSVVDLDKVFSKIRTEGAVEATKLMNEWEYSGKDKQMKKMSIDEFAEKMSPSNGDALVDGTQRALLDLVRIETDKLYQFCKLREASNWIDRFISAIARLRGKPSVARKWMAEVRAALVRLQTGVTLDDREEHPAKNFGLSPGIRPDFLYAVVIGDLKSGEYHDFYRGVATGYVIFAEHVLRRRLNMALILSVGLDVTGGRVASHRIVPVVPDNELRQLWLTRRDDALRILALAEEPNHPNDTSHCGKCHYVASCWDGGKVNGTPLRIVNAGTNVTGSGAPMPRGGLG